MIQLLGSRQDPWHAASHTCKAEVVVGWLCALEPWFHPTLGEINAKEINFYLDESIYIFNPARLLKLVDMIGCLLLPRLPVFQATLL